MTLYRCLYEIDLDAETPEEAALECCNAMRTGVPVIRVIPWNVTESGEELAPVSDESAGVLVDMDDIWFPEPDETE